MESLLVLKQPSCNVFFSWELNVGGFSKHRNKTSDTNRYKVDFFKARFSPVNMITMKKFFEQRSEWQVAEYLIVHLVSSNYNFYSLELRNKRRATQQLNFRVAEDTVLNHVRVYHERVYPDKIVIKVWFVRSFASQHYSKVISNITSGSFYQVRIKKTQEQILRLQSISQLFAVFETLQKWYSFHCDCVFFEWECSWLQQCP